MKTRMLFALALLFVVSGAYAQELANFRRERIVSPEIGETQVIFRFSAPDAELVSLHGSWMDREAPPVDMQMDTAGVWAVGIERPDPELYTYSFIIDGVSVNDPNNIFLQRDGTRYLSVLLVPGERTANYFEAGQRGNIHKVWYDSPTIGTTRRMYVYTPFGYESSKESYPVLYLLHGGGGDEDAWSNMGRAVQILDNLIEKKLAVPMICVMPNGNPGQQAAQTTMLEETRYDRNNPDYWNLYIHSLVKDIVPYIEENYRVISKPEARAISGLSMGGGHTLNATNEYPGTFGYICPLSMGIRDTDTDIDEKLQGVKKAGYELYWVACGNEDRGWERAQAFDAALTRNGLEHTFYETPGGHTWANWRHYLNTFGQLLFK